MLEVGEWMSQCKIKNVKCKIEEPGARLSSSILLFNFAFCISADACYFFEFAQEARLDSL